MTSQTDNQVKPEVRTEANAQKQECDGWTYEYDGEWTYIYDEDGNTVTTFYRKLKHDEVCTFRCGFGIGWDKGIRAGRAQKAIEVKQVLGL